jgi:hypothetical protein
VSRDARTRLLSDQPQALPMPWDICISTRACLD